jgi:hypothetical protein
MTLLEGEAGADRVEKLIRRETVLLPFMALLEVHYVTIQEQGEEEANARYAMLQALTPSSERLRSGMMQSWFTKIPSLRRLSDGSDWKHCRTKPANAKRAPETSAGFRVSAFNGEKFLQQVNQRFAELPQSESCHHSVEPAFTVLRGWLLPKRCPPRLLRFIKQRLHADAREKRSDSCFCQFAKRPGAPEPSVSWVSGELFH